MISPTTNNDPVYFAAKEADQVASHLLKKSQSFYNAIKSNAYLDKLRKMWEYYNGIFGSTSFSNHQVSFTGEQGELVVLPVNHFRNIASHIITMITSNRPIMEARAVNTDYKSLAQTYLANGILDYYMREKHLEDCLKRAAEMAVVLGSGYVKMEWNATAGELYDADPDTGEMNYEGEIEFSNLSPLDVVFDGTKENWNHDWLLVRSFQNRYDLMAKYPELFEQLKGVPSKSDTSLYKLSMFSNDETDDVPVYEFFHKKTEAIPNGRYILFVDNDVILMDAPLPYREIPVFRISASDIMGTPYSYSPMFDIFPIQESINTLYSTIMTNQNAFGVQNLYVPRGADITVNSLDGAMNIIEGNAKPEPLNLTNTPKEIFDFLNMLIQAAETLSGVNSVSRGNPEASLKSGTALALVQSMSLQFVSGLQQSYVKLIEDVGTALLTILKDFATTPKVVALVGKNNRPLLKEFTGDQINDINRVVVDVGNPLSRTIAGRVQMAEQMLQMNLFKNPQQYFEVINTGRLDSAYEGEMDELLLIKRENEFLIDGQEVLVSPLDLHSQHIMEHRAVLADPELRQNGGQLKIVMDHIQAHVDALTNTDPRLLEMIGEKPLPPPGPPPGQQPPGQQGPMPPGGQPPQQQPPQGGAQQGAPVNIQIHQHPPGGAPPKPGSHAMHSKVPQLLTNPNGPVQPGEMVKGPSNIKTNQKPTEPGLPHPPAPFQHLPVTSSGQ